MRRGTQWVKIVRLPTSGDGNKLGLDDFLCAHSVDEFEKLQRLAPDAEPPLEDAVSNLTLEIGKTDRNRVLGRILDEERDPGEQERLLKIARKQTGISLTALRESAQDEARKIQAKRQQEQSDQSPEEARAAAEKRGKERNAAVENILNTAQKTITLRAQTASDRELAYIAALGKAGSVFLCASGICRINDLPENYRVTEPNPDVSPVSVEGIRRFQNGLEVSPVDLFKTLRRFIKSRVIFPHACVPTILALWIMASFCHALFNYFGYIWLTSLGPGCGKSLVAKIVSMLAFNATAPLVDPTPATIFRDIEANCSTLVLDEAEHLDPERKGELLGILNAGFERGSTVRRVERAGERFVNKSFEVYSPKVIAGINQIPRPLQTRAFRIEMRKKKDTEQVKPFRPDRLTKWATLRRDDMAVFALRNSEKIADRYDRRDDLVPRRSDDGRIVFEDRLRDIFAPLFVIAAIIDEEAGEPLAYPELRMFLKLQAGARDSENGGDYVLGAHALYRWADERWRDGKVLVKTSQAKEIFMGAEIEWATSSAGAKSLLRKLGGRNEPLWWKGKTDRGYVFLKKDLEDLVERNPISVTGRTVEKP